jgi:predicted ATPase
MHTGQRCLPASRHIIREDGHWRATREIVNVNIPDTLTGVLSARIDRLPNSTKQVAQTAAVLGRTFEYCAKVWNRSSSLLECDSCPTS